MWQKIRGGLMFVIACITSPCCTPLIVPLGLALLAGTPLAVWLSTNLGWVYGGLTLVSIISFVLGFRWLNQKHIAKPNRKIEHQPISPSIPKVEHS
jgi:predicted MFS family arabinose efflux permease